MDMICSGHSVCVYQFHESFCFKHPHTMSCNGTSCISLELCVDLYLLFGVMDVYNKLVMVQLHRTSYENVLVQYSLPVQICFYNFFLNIDFGQHPLTLCHIHK